MGSEFRDSATLMQFVRHVLATAATRQVPNPAIAERAGAALAAMERGGLLYIPTSAHRDGVDCDREMPQGDASYAAPEHRRPTVAEVAEDIVQTVHVGLVEVGPLTDDDQIDLETILSASLSLLRRAKAADREGVA
jgi:hypothetical protein